MAQSSGLEDILERIAESKKDLDQTENGDNQVVNDDVPLRDRKFTKEELGELEKQTWIEMKDMIFETDPSILDYLTYHCKRWRQTKKGALSDEYNRLKYDGSARARSTTGQYPPQSQAGSSGHQGPNAMRLSSQ